MMLYDQNFIDDLKPGFNLVRIVEHYAAIKKKSSNWMDCCPFHLAKAPYRNYIDKIVG